MYDQLNTKKPKVHNIFDVKNSVFAEYIYLKACSKIALCCFWSSGAKTEVALLLTVLTQHPSNRYPN